jgi:hypothetical protein
LSEKENKKKIFLKETFCVDAGDSCEFGLNPPGILGDAPANPVGLKV